MGGAQRKRHDHELAVAHNEVYLSGALTGIYVMGKFLTTQELPEMTGYAPNLEEKEARGLKRETEFERGFTGPGDVAQ